MNPYWMPQTLVTPQNILPTYAQMMPHQPAQIIPPVQNTIQVQQPKQPEPIVSQTVWNWKVVKDYQSMLQEPVPFDGTPVLYMMQDSSTFYIVNMMDGKKMVNGYEFSPLSTTDNLEQEETPLTAEEMVDQRFSQIETNLANLAEQIQKLVGARNNESNTEVIELETDETVKRKPIK